MAVDCHLDGMTIEVLEHVDPLLGGKDTLKKKVQNQKENICSKNLNAFDAFVVDFCIRRCQKWEQKERCDEHVDSIPCKCVRKERNPKVCYHVGECESQ